MSAKALAEAVREAYRGLAREFHPDVNSDPLAHERMAEINAAFEVLSDPVRRMEYDYSIGHTVTLDPKQGVYGEVRPGFVQLRLLHRHRQHRTPVYSTAYDPAQNRLVTSSFDNVVRWWNAGSSSVERSIKLTGGVVNAIQPGRGDVLVATGSTEQSLFCWLVEGGEVSSWRVSPNSWVCTSVPSPDGKSLAVGSIDRVLRVFGVRDSQIQFTSFGHADSVTALAWSQDSSLLASGSADASVRVWSGKTGSEMLRVDNVRSAVTAVAISSDKRWLAAAAVDFSVRVFDLRSGGLRQKFFGHTKPIESLAFHPGNWLLASASRDGSLGLWNVEKGIGHGQVRASHQALLSLAFRNDGRQIVSGGLDKVLRIWAVGSPD